MDSARSDAAVKIAANNNGPLGPRGLDSSSSSSNSTALRKSLVVIVIYRLRLTGWLATLGQNLTEVSLSHPLWSVPVPESVTLCK